MLDGATEQRLHGPGQTKELADRRHAAAGLELDREVGITVGRMEVGAARRGAKYLQPHHPIPAAERPEFCKMLSDIDMHNDVQPSGAETKIGLSGAPEPPSRRAGWEGTDAQT